MVFYFLAGRCQNTHWGMGLGGGGMTTGRNGAVLRIHHALFRNADKTAGLLYAREYIFHNCAAFVHYHSRLNIMLLKIPDNVGSTLSVDFLTAGEGKINVIFRLEALTDQVIGCGENTVEGNFGIQRTTAPENAILDDPGEGRLLPVFFINRHHIVVSHQHRRITLVLAGPPQQQSSVRKLLKGADIKDPGIQAGQHGNQLVKLGIIFQSRIVVGYRFAANQLRQGIHGCILVKLVFLLRNLRLGLGMEGQCPHRNDGSKNGDQHKNKHS